MRDASGTRSAIDLFLGEAEEKILARGLLFGVLNCGQLETLSLIHLADRQEIQILLYATERTDGLRYDEATRVVDEIRKFLYLKVTDNEVKKYLLNARFSAAMSTD